MSSRKGTKRTIIEIDPPAQDLRLMGQRERSRARGTDSTSPVLTRQDHSTSPGLRGGNGENQWIHDFDGSGFGWPRPIRESKCGCRLDLRLRRERTLEAMTHRKHQSETERALGPWHQRVRIQLGTARRRRQGKGRYFNELQLVAGELDYGQLVHQRRQPNQNLRLKRHRQQWYSRWPQQFKRREVSPW